MNQGARDANAESYRISQSGKQDQILQELRRMNGLLTIIANNTSKDGSFVAPIETPNTSPGGVYRLPPSY